MKDVLTCASTRTSERADTRLKNIDSPYLQQTRAPHALTPISTHSRADKNMCENICKEENTKYNPKNTEYHCTLRFISSSIFSIHTSRPLI